MDSFLKKLPNSPEGHWSKSHINIIDCVKHKINPKNIMEIGLNNGYSTAMWMFTLKNTSLHSIDIGIHPFIKDVQQIFNDTFGDRFTCETMNSKELHNNNYNMYDLIIIDGGHKHDVCLSDLIFSVKHTKNILLDDTGGKSPGVSSALKEFKKIYPNKLQITNKWSSGAGCMLFEVI